jgi:hypothetical protein
MDDLILVSVWAGTSQIGIGFERSAPDGPCFGEEVSSVMLFHDPQSGHFPSHFGD